MITQLTASAETVCWRTGVNHPKYAEGYRWNFQFLGEDIADPDYPVLSGIQSNICPIWEDPDPPTEEERIQRHLSAVHTRVAERELRQQRGAESAVEDEVGVATYAAVGIRPRPGARADTCSLEPIRTIPTPVNMEATDDDEPVSGTDDSVASDGTEPSPDDAVGQVRG